MAGVTRTTPSRDESRPAINGKGPKISSRIVLTKADHCEAPIRPVGKSTEKFQSPGVETFLGVDSPWGSATVAATVAAWAWYGPGAWCAARCCVRTAK